MVVLLLPLRGLKCKILHFTSPLFNDEVPYCTEEPQEAVNKLQVWYGGYKQELWEECLAGCEDFFNDLNTKGDIVWIQQRKYYKDYRNVFRKHISPEEAHEIIRKC